MGKSWLVEQSEHTIFIIKFVYMGMVYGAHTPNSNSNIKDHWSQITITNKKIMKMTDTLQELPNVTQRHKQMLLEKWCWQTCLMRAAIKLPSVKNSHKTSICKKHAITWSTRKGGQSACIGWPTWRGGVEFAQDKRVAAKTRKSISVSLQTR